MKDIFSSSWIRKLNFYPYQLMFSIKEKVLIFLNLEEVRPLQKNHLLERFNYFFA